MAKKAELEFEASAYLQTLIGRELFRRDDFAVLELIKNAYDSGASTVVVTIRPKTAKEPGEITVLDDGSGMSLNDFRHFFMVAGYSERPEEVAHAKRVPTGEKGVGRFATDRLGTFLTVITKTNSEASALKVDIDWTKFSDRRKRFNEISAPFSRVSATHLHGGHGTLLRITGLRNAWPRDQVDALRRSLGRLFNPFAPPQAFSLELNVPGSPKLSGAVAAPAIEAPDIEIMLEVSRDGSVSRVIRAGPSLGQEPITERVRHSFDATSLAGLKGRFLYFLKRPSKRQVGDLPAGVFVYRDGFRIEPFGHETADWLGIEAKRAKRAGHAHVVPSRLFGFVQIRRKLHPDLRDVTSREALLDHDATRALVGTLTREVDRLEELLRINVSEPRWKVKQAEKAAELQRARLQTLSMMSFGLAHELRQPLQAISSEAGNITTRLGALGVNDDEIRDSERTIQSSIKRIDNNIKHIASISTGNLEDLARLDLADVLRGDCALFATRTAAQGITLVQQIPQTHEATLNATTIGMVLANLINNALDALKENGPGQRKEIVVALTGTPAEHVIEVSDTGPGIPEEIQPKIFKRFATKKTGGWGVGLYYCSVIVKARGGTISFSTRRGLGTTFTVRLPEPKAV